MEKKTIKAINTLQRVFFLCIGKDRFGKTYKQHEVSNYCPDCYSKSASLYIG